MRRGVVGILVAWEVIAVPEQLELELEGIDKGRGALRGAAETMIGHLNAAGRLEVEHLPLVALLYKLADALEVSGGRGASVAMLSAQFQEVWEKLSEIPVPDLDGEDDEDFDVQLLAPVTAPDGS